ncbi:SET domain-containing protein [Cytobacillus depressus]|uniref:SET domain-containing protein n=1 Tax=Cytobacillus depressus TaxID=1602942 RepID=A0A6L3V3C8_9BACI|nr:SET domain-containing protein [Cytobacillus depressus]KAB2334456.1 SET domain-containing protein [Cytobacillus depressus]
MLLPYTKLRYINDQVGFGVVATKFIPKGTITWVLDELDYKLEPEFVAKLDKHRRKFINKYSYRNREGKYIFCWDLGKYMNHSFHANCMATAYNFEIAIRDILPGEQLTADYGTLNIGTPFECVPEKGTTRKIVKPDDLLYFYKEWDQMVLGALKHFNDVEQPLINFIDPEIKEKITFSIKNNILLDSVKSNYFDRSLK